MLDSLNSFFLQYQDSLNNADHVFVEGCINDLTNGRELSQLQLQRMQEIVETIKSNQEIDKTLFGNESK